jgi:hypothetical protein
MLVAGLVAMFALVRDRVALLSRYSLVLSGLFVVQSITGAILGLLSAEPSLLRFCASFVLYALLFAAVQYALILGMLEKVKLFAVVTACAGISGLILFVGTLSFIR